MDALTAIMTRRSTRNFSDAPLPESLMEAVLQAGRQAPSGGNSQSNHFFVIQNQNVIEDLIRLTQQAFSRMDT